MTHVACRLTAKNRDQLRNPTLGNRVWATFTFLTLGREITRPETTRSAIHFLFLRSPSPVARYCFTHVSSIFSYSSLFPCSLKFTIGLLASEKNYTQLQKLEGTKTSGPRDPRSRSGRVPRAGHTGQLHLCSKDKGASASLDHHCGTFRLPLTVRDSSLTRTQFCTRLKTFLFTRAYGTSP